MRHESDIGSLGITPWRIGVESPPPPSPTPCPKQVSSCSWQVQTRAWEEKTELVATIGERVLQNNPHELPCKGLQLCLGDLACSPELPNPQLCKGRRAGAGWLSGSQQCVSVQGPGKSSLRWEKTLVTLLGLAWDSPKSCQGHDLTGEGAGGGPPQPRLASPTHPSACVTAQPG